MAQNGPFLEVEEASSSEEDVVSRPPGPNEQLCGFDIRPCLPVFLMAIVLAMAVCVIFLQAHLLGQWTNSSNVYVVHVCVAVGLSLLTIFLAVYCSYADPGRMKVTRGGLLNVNSDLEAANEALPPRAHKTWLYNHPVRRYDHYCRWVNNVIALYNHRTFIAMLYFLAIVPVLHAICDVALVVYVCLNWQPWRWWQLAVLGIHFSVAFTLAYYSVPICKLHTILVCQSVLSSEWRVNRFHNVERNGEMKPAEDTDLESGDEEIYDGSRNPFDKGSAAENCMTFWMTRRNAAETGAF